MRCLDIGRVLSFAQLEQMRDHGDFSGVVPYLDPFNAKGATADYLRDIYAAALSVPGLFYQTTGGAGQGASYFTREQGKTDAARADQLLARYAGLVPPRAIVWYAVDVNVDPGVIDEYANGIEEQATPALQRPGLYGYQRLMQHARASYPNIGKHLAQTYGVQSSDLDLWQHEQITVDGITVDVDEVSVAGWRPPEDVEMDAPQLMGQSADLLLNPGEVGLLQAMYHWPSGVSRAIVRKVHVHGGDRRRIVELYPPEDPDADETLCLDAEPAIFVIDVLPV